MRFSINSKLIFIDSFQLLSSSLDSLGKNLDKGNFKYLSQEIYNNVLDLVKQKGSYPYEYMSDFEKFKEKLPGKEKFYSSLILFRMGPFGSAHGWGRQKSPLPKICHTYPTMMKLDRVIS